MQTPWRSLDRLKTTGVAVVGLLVTVSSFASMLDVVTTVFEALDFIQYAWNALFGLLLMATQAHSSLPDRSRPRKTTPPQLHSFLTAGGPHTAQLEALPWITRRFTFLAGWFGRGMFLLVR